LTFKEHHIVDMKQIVNSSGQGARIPQVRVYQLLHGQEIGAVNSRGSQTWNHLPAHIQMKILNCFVCKEAEFGFVP